MILTSFIRIIFLLLILLSSSCLNLLLSYLLFFYLAAASLLHQPSLPSPLSFSIDKRTKNKAHCNNNCHSYANSHLNFR